MTETGDTGGLVTAATCRCGQPGESETLVVERPPRLVLSATCPEHGRVVPQGVGPAELVRVLESGASVRWPDLSSAALCTALLTCGTLVPTLVVDLDAHTLFSNPAWSALTGLSGAASQGQRWLSALTNESSGTLIGAILSDTAVEVTIAIGVNQRSRWALVPQPILGGRGRPIGHLVLLVDVETAAPGRRAPTATSTDGLSDADGRRDLVVRVAKALEGLSGEHGTVALTLVRLELITSPEETRTALAARIRPVATEGVPVTDREVLRWLGVRLIELSRPGDVVFDLGEGCFALLSEQTGSYAETVQAAQRLVDEAGAPLEALPAQPPMRVSVGIAFPHLPGETAEDVLANAARALDAARSLGGDRVEVVIGTGPGSSDAGPA